MSTGFSATINKQHDTITIAGATINRDDPNAIYLYKSNASNAAEYGYSMLKDGSEWTVPTGKTLQVRAIRYYQSAATSNGIGLGYSVWTSYTSFSGIPGSTYYTGKTGTSSYYFATTPATANLIFEALTPNFNVPAGYNIIVTLPAANGWAEIIGVLI